MTRAVSSFFAGNDLMAIGALAAARERLYALRHGDEARREADAIQARHGSRRSGLPPSGKPMRRGRAVSPGQGELF